MTGLDAAERRGLSLRERLILVLLGERSGAPPVAGGLARRRHARLDGVARDRTVGVEWFDTRATGGFDDLWFAVLCGYALVAVEVPRVLAPARPAGASWITRRTIEQAGGPSPT